MSRQELLIAQLRYANIVLKKADIPMSKRAGELGEEDVEKIITIMQVSNFSNFVKVLMRFVLEPSPVQDP